MGGWRFLAWSCCGEIRSELVGVTPPTGRRGPRDDWVILRAAGFGRWVADQLRPELAAHIERAASVPGGRDEAASRKGAKMLVHGRGRDAESHAEFGRRGRLAHCEQQSGAGFSEECRHGAGRPLIDA